MTYIDPDGREAKDIEYIVFRDVKSYDISTDRKSPRNTYLDMGILYNKKTGESVEFFSMQTVANYPSTDRNGNPVGSCYNDTRAPGRFEIKLYTTTNVATGLAGIIINATTIDGRKVDANGYTENGLSEGRGLEHSNGNPKNPGNDFTTPYSKQCFIMPSKDNTRFFDTLKNWGVEDGDVIEGQLYDIAKIQIQITIVQIKIRSYR